MQICLDVTIAASVTSAPMIDHPMKVYRRSQPERVTLTELAARVGTTAATLSRIEQRKHFPRMTLVARLKAETGLPADAFLPVTHDATPQSVT